MTNMTGLDLTAKALTKMTRIYYSHQVEGMEKIPSTGAAILVWYPGVVPIDYVALVARLYLRDRRMVKSVVHRKRVEHGSGQRFSVHGSQPSAIQTQQRQEIHQLSVR